MKLSEYLIENSIVPRTTGNYDRQRRVSRTGIKYSDMTFEDLCSELAGREYYYQMSRKEGDMLVGMMSRGQYKQAWKFLMTDVRGGDGLWFGDVVNNNIWIIGISSHSAYVYKIVYDYEGKNIESVNEFYIPAGKKFKLWTDSKLADGKEMVDKLLEK